MPARQRTSTPPLALMLADWSRWCRGGHGGYVSQQGRTPAQRRALSQYAHAVRYGKPLPELNLVDTPAAVFRRARRALARRRARHDGVKYDDRMSSDPVVMRQVCADLGIPYRPRRRS